MLRLATLAALAAAWVVAILLLWRSRVPGGLDVTGLSARDYFSSDLLRKTDHYERFHRVNYVLSTLTTIVVFVLYAWRGARFTRESAAGPIGTGMLLAMLGFALVWLVEVPFVVAGQWWDRRYGISDAGYLEVIFGGWLLLGAGFVFLCASVLIVMGLARLFGQRWWPPGAAAFVGLAALFTFISPYTVTDAKPLRDPQLAADARTLARAEGVSGIPVEVEDVDEYTDAANAYTTGLGPSRKVFLWNTLLDGRFTRGEVRVVLAHEFAHQAREHLLKGIAWYALFAVPGAFLIAVATRRRGGMRAPESVPLALLVLVVLSTLATPFQNAISRRIEAEADWVALETTRDPGSARTLFERFAKTGLGDPNPPTWAYLWFDSHPTLMQRIAMVERWQERRGR